jgi:heme A synthase
MIYVTIAFGVLMLLVLIGAAIVSWRENEPVAAVRLGLAAIVVGEALQL